MDVDRHGGLGKSQELLVGDVDRLPLGQAEQAEAPDIPGHVRYAAIVQDRPFLRHILPGRNSGGDLRVHLGLPSQEIKHGPKTSADDICIVGCWLARRERIDLYLPTVAVSPPY